MILVYFLFIFYEISIIISIQQEIEKKINMSLDRVIICSEEYHFML